jgi:hypothetical protein
MFNFALAERLGMTVRQMLNSLDSAELTDWMAYMRLKSDKQTPLPEDDSEIWRKAFNC